MRVCDVVLNSVWFDPRVRKQIKEYINNGFDVCCVGLKCRRYNEENVKKIPCPVKLADYGEKYAGKLNSVFKKLKRLKITNQKVTQAIIEFHPDVIHANDLDALIPAYKAAKKLKCRIIYDSHEINTENYTSRKQRLWYFFLRMKEKSLCRKVDKMVCVSNAAAEYFMNEYGIDKPMVVTHGALRDEIIEKSGEKNPGFEILNHGQFYAGRGYDIMIEAAALLKDYPDIHMALRGFGVLEEQLKSRAQELGLDNVIFYPGVKIEELIPEASRSMVGLAITVPICLNFKLSVSNKLFEYAAAGLPVIMSDIPEHRYLNDKYHFGIILKENTPEELKNAAVKLYEDKELYKKCQENAQRLSREMNWENEFSKLTSFILSGNAC